MVRPFRYGDIFLIQRLGRQAAKLNIIQATIHRQSALGASLTSGLPWRHGKASIYILRQRGNRLARAGFLQDSKRPGRPELDIVYLAPGLDARRGHPAIWEKLLSYHSYAAANRKIERIYADVPDQPLPVNTFMHAGYRTYDRQEIWRLTPMGLDSYASQISADIRPQKAVDEWALEQIYRRNVPQSIQTAEGMQNGDSVRPSILGWTQGGAVNSYVLKNQGEVRGSIQIARGTRGVWLQTWCDYIDPDAGNIHQLLRFALTGLHRGACRLPIYIAVRQYHGALGSVLTDYNFAPFTDRAMMVKHVFQWVREASPASAGAMESAPTVATTPFDLYTCEQCCTQYPASQLGIPRTQVNFEELFRQSDRPLERMSGHASSNIVRLKRQGALDH